ncbi:MAG: glycosyltransferase family 39 protein [Candidatus Bathyarchaeota archaeon]|nr:MAG: glycosyltransferase family 39 protein [Candidatus Bathyarchaeota archaeon]
MTKTEKRRKPAKYLLYQCLLLVAIVSLGLILRLYHLQFYIENGGEDAMWYIHAGVKYSNGNWLTPTVTYKGPFLTALLSLFFGVFGSTYITAKFVSLLAGSLLPISTFLLGSELFGKKAGFLGAFIVSINPLLIFYHGLVYREIVFSFIWTTSIYLTMRGFKGNILYAIIGGVLFALSSATIELGIFAGIGLILFFFFERIKSGKKASKFEYKNLDMFFLGAFITLVPFILKNQLAYKQPFIQWTESLDFLRAYLPFSESVPMILYVGFMALSIPYILAFRVSHVYSRSKRARVRNKLNHFLVSSVGNHYKAIKICLAVLLPTAVAVVLIYEFYKGFGPVARSLLGLVKLSEALASPEALGFLLVISAIVVVYTLRSSRDVVLVTLAFVFSAIGLAYGITTHYITTANLEFNEILPYHPRSPLDNSFRYISSYVPFLAIFASYGVLLIEERLTRKLSGLTWNGVHKTRMLRITIFCALISAILVQFVYADVLLRVKTQRDFDSLQAKYEPVVIWLSNQGSPVIYSFNNMLDGAYGEDRVVLLTRESLMDIARRASDENITFIVSDVFGAYSDAQLALFLGGLDDNPSYIRLDRFTLAKSYKGWPSVQIFEISKVALSQMALVVQHESWGQEWVSFLSESYLVDSITDAEDFTTYLSEDYKLIVLTELKRTLTSNEMNILRQRVASGTILIVNGLSPAYMDLENSGDWIGAANFVEAPRDAKWSIRFTESATNVTTDIDTSSDYALYTSSPYSSPTGLTGIKTDVVVYATRRDDGAAVIFAKPYGNGTVIFSGVRPGYAPSAKDYGIYIKFIEALLERADDKTLFP